MICDIDYNSKTHMFRDFISLIITHFVTPADTKCPPAHLYIYTNINRVLIVRMENC